MDYDLVVGSNATPRQRAAFVDAVKQTQGVHGGISESEGVLMQAVSVNAAASVQLKEKLKGTGVSLASWGKE